MSSCVLQCNLDTIGPDESVLIREVSLFQGLKSTQTLNILGEEESVLIRGVSLFQGLKSTQTLNILGEEECVLFRELSYFRGVLIEGFHCITIMMYMYGMSSSSSLISSS